MGAPLNVLDYDLLKTTAFNAVIVEKDIKTICGQVLVYCDSPWSVCSTITNKDSFFEKKLQTLAG